MRTVLMIGPEGKDVGSLAASLCYLPWQRSGLLVV